MLRITRARLRLASLSLLLASAAGASLFGRDKVLSGWTAVPIAVTGDDSAWDPQSAFESDGLSVSARNDANDLYLLITAHTRDGREQLTGEARENVALWAVAADGRTRSWGALLPFSHRAPLAEAIQDPAGVDPLPEYAVPAGVSVSTDAWPAEIANRLATSARRPVWELKIPCRRLTPRRDGSYAFDFVVTGSGAVRAAPPATLEEGTRRRGTAPVRSAPEGVSLFVSVKPAGPPEAAR
ncbi:MAG: hypothetical protein ACHQ51_05540 [Elusimicrobiota bacterium]